MPLRLLLPAVIACAASAQISWVKQQASNPVPKGALISGTEQEGANDGLRWYVCRIVSKDGVAAGKGSTTLCNTVMNGKALRGSDFEIAVAKAPGKWQSSRTGYGGALTAGKWNGSDIYVCRGIYITYETGVLGTKEVNRGLHSGGAAGNGPCLVEWGNKVVTLAAFELYIPAR